MFLRLELLSEAFVSLLLPFSAVAYMVSPVAVTKFDESDAAAVVVVAVDLVVVVMLLLVLEEEEEILMYRGWD